MLGKPITLIIPQDRQHEEVDHASLNPKTAFL
ncbi:hypothetical protein JL111_19855 [Paracoccus sp. KCTC 42845]|uniref:Uncharacterized protein n=1 Tax=Paracoccus aerius TaxID=1915382 RepID=A0ABS1SAE9_9RHOB|nr:hypothetical protein [Paracoccus aerius]